MNIDELLEQHLKNSLNTCLDMKEITVSEELKKKTMARIQAAKEKEDIKNIDTNEMAATEENLQKYASQKVLSLEEQRARKVRRLRVVTNTAAVLLLLFVGVGVLGFFGRGMGSKKESSCCDSLFAPSENDMSVTESSEASGSDYNKNAFDGVKDNITIDKDVSDHYKEESSNGMTADAEEEMETIEGTIEYTAEYPYSFEEICGFDATSTNGIVMRNIKNQTMKEISNVVEIRDLFRVMNGIAYGDMKVEPTDPDGWDYVLEITYDNKSTLQIWLGDYLVVSSKEGTKQCYQMSDVEHVMELLDAQ